jgi:hypothetical protein
MSDTRIVLVAFNANQGMIGKVNLAVLMKRALRIEKRMETKVLIEDEQRRYNTYCERIEFYGHRLWVENIANSCDLGNMYLDLISKMRLKYPEETTKLRVSASFCPYEQISGYVKQFVYLSNRAGLGDKEEVKKKIEFYKKAEADGCSIIELLQPWMPSSVEKKNEIDSAKLRESFLDLEISDSITLRGNGDPLIALKNQIAGVVDLTMKNISAAINFSELGHNFIAEALHEYAYMKGRPIYAPVIYADGSEAKPFPLFCLKQRSMETLNELHKLPIMNVGMMSARHSNDGLDIMVKTYWFRNQEISIGRTQAETDEVAYKKSKENFLALRPEGPYRIAFYQTGFQPAVVGFYRALVEELIFREKKPPELEVIPYYLLRDGYKIGEIWN